VRDECRLDKSASRPELPCHAVLNCEIGSATELTSPDPSGVTQTIENAPVHHRITHARDKQPARPLADPLNLNSPEGDRALSQ
jgi:hypothetical protein